jgi:GNAT superfamily N-acetyltransferase
MDIRELTEGDNIAAFTCGNGHLDGWIKTHARDNRRRGFCTTYVAVENGTVVGFVATSATSVERARVKRGRGPETWPAMLIARMGVAMSRQHGGIGKRLIAHAFNVAAAQYRLSGCAAVIVDAKPEAEAFYRQFGFDDLLVLERDPARTESSAIRLYLPIATVQEAIDDATQSEVEAPTPAA